MEAKLIAGTGMRKITPAPALVPNLRGLGNRRFSGVVLRDLLVRVLALRTGDRLAILTAIECDKVPYPEQFIRLLERTTGAREEDILIFSTHIHTAPVCGIRPDEPFNSAENRAAPEKEAERQYTVFLLEQTRLAAEEAVSSLQPARIGWQEETSAINVNRVQDYHVELSDGTNGTVAALGFNPEGPVDRALFVMRIESLAGFPIAFFLNYAVHNAVLIGADSDSKGGLPISSDLAGEVCAMLEARYPGAAALWSSGAAGDVNPIWFNEYSYPDEETGMPACAHAKGMDSPSLALQVLSRRHYADVLRVLQNVTCTDAAFQGGAVQWIRTPGRICAGETDGPSVFRTEGAPPYEIRAQMLRIGDIALCGFSGELYTTLGWKVKEAVRQAHAVVINHNLSLLANSGYIFDDETIRRLDNSVVKTHIPGYGKESHILPGYVSQALSETTEMLFRSIGRTAQK